MTAPKQNPENPACSAKVARPLLWCVHGGQDIRLWRIRIAALNALDPWNGVTQDQRWVRFAQHEVYDIKKSVPEGVPTLGANGP